MAVSEGVDIFAAGVRNAMEPRPGHSVSYLLSFSLDFSTFLRRRGTEEVIRSRASEKERCTDMRKLKHSNRRAEKGRLPGLNPHAKKRELRRAHRPDWYLEPKWLRYTLAGAQM